MGTAEYPQFPHGFFSPKNTFRLTSKGLNAKSTLTHVQGRRSLGRPAYGAIMIEVIR